MRPEKPIAVEDVLDEIEYIGDNLNDFEVICSSKAMQIPVNMPKIPQKQLKSSVEPVIVDDSIEVITQLPRKRRNLLDYDPP